MYAYNGIHYSWHETNSLLQKLLAVVQDNNTYRKAQERMESQIYAQEQDLVQAQKENQLLKKRNKDLEKRLENEVQTRSWGCMCRCKGIAADSHG